MSTQISLYNPYTTSCIYAITCKLDSSLIYIGSTVDLPKRWTSHTNHYNNPHTTYFNMKISKTMNELGVTNFEVKKIIDVCVFNKKQLSMIEGCYIRKFGTLNTNIAGRNMKQYYLDNKDKFNKKLISIKNEDNKLKQLLLNLVKNFETIFFQKIDSYSIKFNIDKNKCRNLYLEYLTNNNKKLFNQYKNILIEYSSDKIITNKIVEIKLLLKILGLNTSYNTNVITVDDLTNRFNKYIKKKNKVLLLKSLFNIYIKNEDLNNYKYIKQTINFIIVICGSKLYNNTYSYNNVINLILKNDIYNNNNNFIINYFT
jgi:hypothetical protein